jgi:hypothetical protein
MASKPTTASSREDVAEQFDLEHEGVYQAPDGQLVVAYLTEEEWVFWDAKTFGDEASEPFAYCGDDGQVYRLQTHDPVGWGVHELLL